MSGYIPTTTSIMETYATAVVLTKSQKNKWDSNMFADARDTFMNWLQDHDKKIKAEVWEEGSEAALSYQEAEAWDITTPFPNNPYKEDS